MLVEIYDGMVGNQTVPTVQVRGEEGDTPKEVTEAYLEVKKLLKKGGKGNANN